MSSFSFPPETSCLFSETTKKVEQVNVGHVDDAYRDCGGSRHVPTVSLQLGELLGQSVLTVLQLPLLLLHVLHVVSQRPDLGLVLHTEGTTHRGGFTTNMATCSVTHPEPLLVPRKEVKGKSAKVPCY